MWTLHGRDGIDVDVMTYGGIVSRLLVPGIGGRKTDVVLGFNDLESYLAGHPYFGAIIGRVAGRITGAGFSLEGKSWKLAENDPPNHLHGGVQGFDKKLWKASPVSRSDDSPSLRMTRCSPDGEEGYPGTVYISVTYTVVDSYSLLIETEANTDKPTPFSLAHHSYFNLAGEDSGSIAKHELQIYSDQFVPTNDQMTLLGYAESVTGQTNDFRQLRRLGDTIPLLFQNRGDLYVIRRKALGKSDRAVTHAACLVHEDSVLNVFTTETHLQLYTAAYLDGSHIGKSGNPYPRYAGVCLECHGYPDGANAPQCGDIILRPGHPQRHTTAYTFSNKLVLQL